MKQDDHLSFGDAVICSVCLFLMLFVCPLIGWALLGGAK